MRRSSSWRVDGKTVFFVVLCCALVFFCGLIQATHTHADQQHRDGFNSECGLCNTAHVGLQATIVILVAAAATVVTFPPVAQQRAEFSAIIPFDLYVRPPPVR